MAKPKDVSQLSDAQRKQLSRDGHIMADGTRYALDERTGKFFVQDQPQHRFDNANPGRPPKPGANAPRRISFITTQAPHQLVSERLRRDRKGGRARITPEDQNQYYEHETPDDFLGMLDLYEKRKKRGWS